MESKIYQFFLMDKLLESCKKQDLDMDHPSGIEYIPAFSAMLFDQANIRDPGIFLYSFDHVIHSQGSHTDGCQCFHFCTCPIERLISDLNLNSWQVIVNGQINY